MTRRRRLTRVVPYVLQVLRLVSLVALAGLGTVLLVRSAPGYFSRSGEMDAEHSASARQQAAEQQRAEGSALQVSRRFLWGLAHGDAGRSHQYGEPVVELMRPRLRATARVLLPAILLAPLIALLVALPCSQSRSAGIERAVATATLLGVAVPVSVLAGAGLLSGWGGPATVLLTVVAARDFRFFTRLLRKQSKATYLLYSRACGTQPLRATVHGVLLPVRSELLSLFALSFVTALGSLVPVEVIFGIPGLGQMAWNAAMNRDLPVLLSVTLLMALCIALAGMVANGGRPPARAVAA